MPKREERVAEVAADVEGLGDRIGSLREPPECVERPLDGGQRLRAPQVGAQLRESFLRGLRAEHDLRQIPPREVSPHVGGIAVNAASHALGPPLWRIAGHGAHVRRHGDLQELQVS